MTTAELIEQLNGADSLKGLEDLLNRYLLQMMDEAEQRPERRQQIAYEIAGLMGTRAVVATHEPNPYLSIMLLAGQLELPAHHRSPTASWKGLAALVRSLR